MPPDKIFYVSRKYYQKDECSLIALQNIINYLPTTTVFNYRSRMLQKSSNSKSKPTNHQTDTIFRRIVKSTVKPVAVNTIRNNLF